MNLFATILTYPAPSANYRGESELNRTVIQKVTDGRFDYPIISPEAMRNALREILAKYGLPCNRERIHPVTGKGKTDDGAEADKQQLAVKYSKYPDPEEFVDDFFFGYLLAVKAAELTKLRNAKGEKFPMKRDSVLPSILPRPSSRTGTIRSLPNRRSLQRGTPGNPVAATQVVFRTASPRDRRFGVPVPVRLEPR